MKLERNSGFDLSFFYCKMFVLLWPSLKGNEILNIKQTFNFPQVHGVFLAAIEKYSCSTPKYMCASVK